jgi:hypothetical protein
MGIAVSRHRLVSALVAAVADLGTVMANALPPSASSLEVQAQAEFDKAGSAVHERLEREASGDLIGARVAAQEADAHRYRFLDLKRKLSRLHPQPLASPPVAAPRDPFLPSGSFLAPSAPLASRTIRVTTVDQHEVVRASYPAWDMYRPHLSGEGAETDGRDAPQVMQVPPVATARGRAGDMYTTGFAKPVPADRGAAAQEPEAPGTSGEAPRQPFLVYRERLAGSGTLD